MRIEAQLPDPEPGLVGVDHLAVPDNLGHRDVAVWPLVGGRAPEAGIADDRRALQPGVGASGDEDAARLHFSHWRGPALPVGFQFENRTPYFGFSIRFQIVVDGHLHLHACLRRAHLGRRYKGPPAGHMDWIRLDQPDVAIEPAPWIPTR